MEDAELRAELEKFATAVQEGFYNLTELMDEKGLEAPVNQAVDCLAMSLGSIIFEVTQTDDNTMQSLSDSARYDMYDKVLEEVVIQAKTIILSLERERNSLLIQKGEWVRVSPVPTFAVPDIQKDKCHD